MSAQSNKPQFYDEYDLKVVDPNWLQQRVKPKRHIGLEADLCILCRACEDVCPWDCIYMLSGEIVADADSAAIKDQSGNAAAVFFQQFGARAVALHLHLVTQVSGQCGVAGLHLAFRGEQQWQR